MENVGRYNFSVDGYQKEREEIKQVRNTEIKTIVNGGISIKIGNKGEVM